MSHTPGPWKIAERKRPDESIFIIDNHGEDIAKILFAESDGITEANARLMIAVHDLLSVCRSVCDLYVPERNCSCHINPPCSYCVEYGEMRDLVDSARAAIKKATGEK